MKKFFVLFFIMFFSCPLGFAAAGTTATYVIDPEKNAFEHNNKGVMYVEEQSTAVYFNNLGKVYMTIGYPELALDCFHNAVTQYSLNFEYYQNLANCYKALGQLQKQIKYYQTKDSNPLNKVMLGLLYELSGDKRKAVIVFDEFAMAEPNLIITPAVKKHIQKLVSELQKI